MQIRPEPHDNGEAADQKAEVERLRNGIFPGEEPEPMRMEEDAEPPGYRKMEWEKDSKGA